MHRVKAWCGAWWLAAAGVLLLGLLATWPSTLWASVRCTAHRPVPWRNVVPGVWVWQAPDGGDVSAANGGHVLPTSVVISGRQALVIDPGPSHRHGTRLRQSLACRFGVRVSAIVNTHAHAENVLANSAFAKAAADSETQIVASEPTREGMALRCPDCLSSLRQRVGEQVMEGTRIVLPTRLLAAGEELRLGRWRLQVVRIEHAHTEGDLVLWSPSHRLLWAGGLVYQRRVPELAQGQIDGWLAALARLEDLRPRHVIATMWEPARESGVALAAIGSTRAYLEGLRSQVLAAMDRGSQPQEAQVAELPEFAHWAGYEKRHGFNVLRAWRELEPVWMDRVAPSK